jgi:hypothetical protein
MDGIKPARNIKTFSCSVSSSHASQPVSSERLSTLYEPLPHITRVVILYTNIAAGSFMSRPFTRESRPGNLIKTDECGALRDEVLMPDAD